MVASLQFGSDEILQRYQLPGKREGRKRKCDPTSRFADSLEWKNVNKRQVELKNLELSPVPYLLEHPWSEFMTSKIRRSLQRKWHFGSNIEKSTLDGYAEMKSYLYDR